MHRRRGLQIGLPEQPLGQRPAEQAALVLHSHLPVKRTEVAPGRITPHIPQRRNLAAAVAAGDGLNQLALLPAQLQRLPLKILQAAIALQPATEHRIDGTVAPQQHHQRFKQLALGNGIAAADGIGARVPDRRQPFV